MLLKEKLPALDKYGFQILLYLKLMNIKRKQLSIHSSHGTQWPPAPGSTVRVGLGASQIAQAASTKPPAMMNMI